VGLDYSPTCEWAHKWIRLESGKHNKQCGAWGIKHKSCMDKV